MLADRYLAVSQGSPLSGAEVMSVLQALIAGGTLVLWGGVAGGG